VAQIWSFNRMMMIPSKYATQQKKERHVSYCVTSVCFYLNLLIIWELGISIVAVLSNE